MLNKLRLYLPPGADETDETTLLVAAAHYPFKPTIGQQIIRSLISTFTFGLGYLIMLFAMYYNGYIIFSIVASAYIGAFCFQWDTLSGTYIPTAPTTQLDPIGIPAVVGEAPVQMMTGGSGEELAEAMV